MPRQKDLKRLVRSRMQKTGEAYTAARLQLLKKASPAPEFAGLAGMSDAAVSEKTGRTWAEWVKTLDAAGAAGMPHREIARHVASLGTPSWWTQMVTVGYERIRGLRARGQQRGGSYQVSRSRTFPVSVETLFDAFANARTRRRWLPVKVTVRTARPHRTLRMTWEGGTLALFGFTAKGGTKSAVAVEHQKLPDRAAAQALKTAWDEYFDRLARILA
ncbi:MAG TPA: hypothetical protein VGO79_03560 [Thermoanaerobaculia bacterium]